MQVDEMITLENGKKYGLLLESELENNKYFLAVMVDDNEEPLNDFKVFKEMVKNNETFVLEEKDPLILDKLLEEYYLELDEV